MIACLMAAPLAILAILYSGGFLGQILGNYAAWKQGGGVPGDGTSPVAASPDFFTCLTSVLRPPYGVYGVLICIGLLAILLLMVMKMGYSDTGEYDTDRNFIYSAKGTYGTSGWMSRKEMAGVLDLVPDLRKHKGVVLGMLDGKAVCIPENPKINGNLAVYGSSGSMKTRSFCMNRILQAVIRGESLIISDPKSELYEKSSEYLRYQGYCVKVFNLVLPENSDSWNCLSEVEGQELMAQLFVDVIIKNTNSTGKGDHFWDSCEMNLLKALVLYVDQSYAAENRNIGEVYRLLTLNGESDLDNLFDVLPPTHPAKAPYSLFKQASDTVRSGVIMGLGSRLQVFRTATLSISGRKFWATATRNSFWAARTALQPSLSPSAPVWPRCQYPANPSSWAPGAFPTTLRNSGKLPALASGLCSPRMKCCDCPSRRLWSSSAVRRY